MSAPSPKTDYVRKVQQDVNKLVQDLLLQGERLRTLLSTLEDDKTRLQSEVDTLREQLRGGEARTQELSQELSSIASENRELAERYGSIERQSSNLANLYVASYRLHGTLEREEVLATIQEIVANLIGCEEMALFELAEDGSTLRLATSVGIDPSPWRTLAAIGGLIVRCLRSGQRLIVDDQSGVGRSEREQGLTACVPLMLGGKPSGVIAMFGLLPQKNGAYEEVDHELMDLLATHAGTALYCASLHTRFAGQTA